MMHERSGGTAGGSTGARVVVVGDPALGGRLGPGAAAGVGGGAVEVVCVEDYLQAIGELSRAPAGGIVGRLAPMRHCVEATLGALRRVAPRTPIVLVVEPASEPEAMRAVRLGADDYLVEPMRRGELGATLGRLAAEHGGLPVAIDHVATESAGGAVNRTESEEPSEAAAATPTPSSEAGTSGSSSAAGLGFDGLAEASDRWVERLLSERGTVRDALLEDIRSRHGADVTWAAEPALDALACLPIVRGSRAFGYLVSDSVGDQALAGEADRLARWLALEGRLDELKHLAMHDELTGVWNRRYFDQFLASVIRRAQQQRFRVTLMLFDIDDFKHYNDEYGHAAGDEILREAGRLMTSVVRRHDVVARIGGDEFAVIFWDADPPRKQRSQHPGSVRTAAARFQRAICDHRFPKLSEQAQGTLTVSGGLASYPWDGQTPEALMGIADDMLLRSKRQGKNAITFGPGAERACPPGSEADAAP